MADYFHYMINHKSTIISTQLDMTDEYREGLIEQAYNIGDIQKRSTNLVGDMSSWKVWEE